MGTRLGIITNQEGKIFDLNEEIKFSILLKLFILPFIVFLISKFLNFDFYQSSAVILQAGTPTAISTILMAEAYDVKQKIASKILFTTTLISIFTIPLLKILLNLSIQVVCINKFINSFNKGIVIIEIKVVVKRIFEAIFCFTP